MSDDSLVLLVIFYEAEEEKEREGKEEQSKENGREKHDVNLFSELLIFKIKIHRPIKYYLEDKTL